LFGGHDLVGFAVTLVSAFFEGVVLLYFHFSCRIPTPLPFLWGYDFSAVVKLPKDF